MTTQEAKKRLLVLWPNALRKDLGGPKIVMEFAEAMTSIGWECTLFDPATLPEPGEGNSGLALAMRWRSYLKREAARFDVVEVDHAHFPFDRDEFAPSTLLVARSGLLGHHFTQIKIPELNPLKDRVRRWIKGPAHNERYEENRVIAQRTCEQADAVNVANNDDKTELIRSGIPAEKIGVFPFGLSPGRRIQFARLPGSLSPRPTVAFVGSFDARKGACEFPGIVKKVQAKIPNVLFKFLGTKGVFRSREEVLKRFPQSLHSSLEVLPEYPPDALPTLLSDCWMGVFPSYIEGFPFGVLEMLSAGLPVVAYEAPGAPMMLGREFLVPRGDGPMIATKILSLLLNREHLTVQRAQAKQRSEDFSWVPVAEATSEFYLNRIASLTRAR